jgi:formiminotetrahydrofolate cyclodeaminase
MKTKAKTKTTKKTTTTTSFAAAIADVLATAQAMRASLDALDLASLTEEERRHSAGKLRNGEAAAMTTILDTVDAFPQAFEALAPKDNGVNPNVVETAPSRASLARSQTLAPLAIVLESLVTRVSDDMLASAKEVTTPAYAIGKANAASNPKVRKSLATAIDFYTKASRHTSKPAKTAKPAKSTGATATS